MECWLFSAQLYIYIYTHTYIVPIIHTCRVLRIFARFFFFLNKFKYFNSRWKLLKKTSLNIGNPRKVCKFHFSVEYLLCTKNLIALCKNRKKVWFEILRDHHVLLLAGPRESVFRWYPIRVGEIIQTQI